MVGFWVLVILFFVTIAAIPRYSYNRGWGYWPGGILLALLLLWLILLYFGAVAFYWPWNPEVVD
jgi:hypothetical protein